MDHGFRVGVRSVMKRPMSFGKVAVVVVAVGLSLGFSALQLGFVHAAGPQVPLDKQVVIDAYKELETQGGTPPAKHPDSIPIVPVVGADQPGPYSISASGSGHIVEAPLGPPGVIDATFSNAWNATTPEGTVEVYAGRLNSDPTQGLVIVAVWDSDHAVWLGGGRFLTPRKIGGVRVAGAAGSVLTLRGDTGTTVSFDAVNRAFR